jgi:hypothetical protein
MYLYICGSLGGRSGPDLPSARDCGKQSRNVYGAEPGRKVFSYCLIDLLSESLNSEYERMCDLCVIRVTEPVSHTGVSDWWQECYPILRRK